METKNLKIAIIDIDGCLSKYPNKIFFEYVKDITGKNFKTKFQIIEAYDVFYYEKLKYKFRMSGNKINYKLNPGVAETFALLKTKGFLIEIVTSREKLIDNILTTRNWLNKNNLIYDKLSFISRKGCYYLDPINLEKLLVIDDDYAGLIDYINFQNVTLFKFGGGDVFKEKIFFVDNWAQVSLNL